MEALQAQVYTNYTYMDPVGFGEMKELLRGLGRAGLQGLACLQNQQTIDYQNHDLCRFLLSNHRFVGSSYKIIYRHCREPTKSRLW